MQGWKLENAGVENARKRKVWKTASKLIKVSNVYILPYTNDAYSN